MDISFPGKRALVSGAAGGIGSAVVESLVKCGAEVIALDINATGLKDLKKKLPTIDILCVDLLDWDATKQAAEQCPHIDLLVNCAGILNHLRCGQIDESSFDKMFGTNIKAVVNLSQAISEKMKASKQKGAIVNISSRASTRPHAGCLLYSATKAALDMVTRTMALELEPHKIRVNSVNPSAVNTALLRNAVAAMMDPDKTEKYLASYPMEPEEVANTILFLLSDKAEMINGALVSIDGTIH